MFGNVTALEGGAHMLQACGLGSSQALKPEPRRQSEEITVTYISEDCLERPTHLRRRFLATWSEILTPSRLLATWSTLKFNPETRDPQTPKPRPPNPKPSNLTPPHCRFLATWSKISTPNPGTRNPEPYIRNPRVSHAPPPPLRLFFFVALKPRYE